MIRVFFLLILVALPYTAIPAAMPTQPAGYTGNINRSIGITIANQLVARGYQDSDPRHSATFSAISTAATAAAVGAIGTALTVAGAPVWATLLAGAAVTGGLTYATVGLQDWYFGDPASPTPLSIVNSQKPITDVASLTNPVAPAFVAPPVWSDSLATPTSGPALTGTQVTESIWDGSMMGTEPIRYDPPFVGNNLDPTRYKYQTVGGQVGTVSPNILYSNSIIDLGMQNAYFIILWYETHNASTYSDLCVLAGCTVDPVTGVSQRVLKWQAYPVPNATACTGTNLCSASMRRKFFFYDGTSKEGPVSTFPFFFGLNIDYNEASNPVPAVPVPVSFPDAVDHISPGDLSAPIDPAAIAALVNALWKAAAALPGYAGVPYEQSFPILPADVAIPSIPPNSDIITTPFDATGVVPIPIPVDVPVDPTAPPATLDLGPDPGIPSPELEETPTAAMILAPILGLMPELRGYVVPSHTGVCPQPSAEIFGKTLVMTAHCELIDSIRPTIYPLMAALWSLIGVIIILRA